MSHKAWVVPALWASHTGSEPCPSLCPGGASGQSALATGKTETRYLTPNPYPSPAMTKIECTVKYIKTIGTQLGKQLRTGGCSRRRSHLRCSRGGGRSDSSHGNSGAPAKITEFKGRHRIASWNGPQAGIPSQSAPEPSRHSLGSWASLCPHRGHPQPGSPGRQGREPASPPGGRSCL